MSKKILIDSFNNNETKFFLLNKNNKIEEFDYQLNKKTTKGNIYLGKINKIEPSLQAAFVECGLNKKCFLPFDMINPNYFQIPIADKNIYRTKIQQDIQYHDYYNDDSEYKIQEVLKKDQILLVQVEKENKGNKGSYLTTFISISGKFCIYYPNAQKVGIKISRKIDNENERRRLKLLADKLLTSHKEDSLILRTASAFKNKTEISKDFIYLRRIWNSIKKSTISAFAPSLVYEESDLVINSIKNFFTSDINKIIISGKNSYVKVKNFIKIFSPHNINKIEHYTKLMPLLYQYKLDKQFSKFFLNKIQLESGGSFIINITEALISIDVNSGKCTKEYSIEDTALKINLGAVKEIARQIRFRGLSGIIVIDFIDMYEIKNKKSVEKALKKALWHDRAKIQFGRISDLGLFEMTRQRINKSFYDKNTISCKFCNGRGRIISKSSISFLLLEKLKYKLFKKYHKFAYIFTTTDITTFINNYYRSNIIEIENKFNTKLIFYINDLEANENFKFILENKIQNYFENKFYTSINCNIKLLDSFNNNIQEKSYSYKDKRNNKKKYKPRRLH